MGHLLILMWIKEHNDYNRNTLVGSIERKICFKG